MRRVLFALPLLALPLLAVAPEPVESACCYFAAKDKDILQPAQKAFLTWDEREKVETFTVQPRFEGNAKDFGMVIPTPSKPKLDEMPRDFFKELAVFTILEPMDLSKYKRRLAKNGLGGGGGGGRGKDDKKETVKVLEMENGNILHAWVIGLPHFYQELHLQDEAEPTPTTVQ